MKTFEVLLSRAYRVKIDAKNEAEARHLIELYVGGERDLSNDHERLLTGFRINEIEMTVNEAFESNETADA